MKRYAFIDVQNTEGTTKELLGFDIDWKKLYLYLTKKWNCEEVLFYSGIDKDDTNRGSEFNELQKFGYKMRVKPYSIYNNQDRIIKIRCSKCLNMIEYKIGGNIRWKSNCDTELSVDITNLAGENKEFIIFTGDGDFEYVIRNALSKGTKVYIVSCAKKIKTGIRYSVSRFSTKLRKLIAEMKNSVFYVDIDTWKLKIIKEYKKENATQVGVF